MFKRFLRTLGAAPTTAGTQLGSTVTLSLSLGTNATVQLTQSPYNTGSFTFNNLGVWIVNYTIQGQNSTINSGIQGWVSIIPSSQSFSSGSSTAPIVGTDVPISTNYLEFASGSFVTTITESTTFNMYIYVYTGSFFTQKSRYIVTFTRIG